MENLSNSLSLFNPTLCHAPPPPQRAANFFHLLAYQDIDNGNDGHRYNSYNSYDSYAYEDLQSAQAGALLMNSHHHPNPPSPTPFSFFQPRPLDAHPSLPLFEASTIDHINGHPNLSLFVANHGSSADPHEDTGVADHSTAPKRTSIYRGVTKHRWTGRFEAHLWDNSCTREGSKRKGRQVYLGGYEKEEDAAHSYDLASLKFWGPTATINYPLSHYEKELVEMRHMTRHEYVSSLRRKSSGFSRGASKYRGVTRHHQHGRWQARIGRVAGNKDLYLGTFATQEEAAEAYDMAAVKFRGMNAVTNFDINRYNVSTILEGTHIPPPCLSMSSSRSKSTSEEQETSESGNAMSNESLVGATSKIFGAKEATTSNNLESMNINHAIEWNFLSLVQDDNSGSDLVEMGGTSSGLAKMGEDSFKLLDKLDMSNNTFPFDNNVRAHVGVFPQGLVSPQYYPHVIGKDQNLRAQYIVPYMKSKNQDLRGANLACS